MKILLSILSLLISVSAFAQGELDLQNKIFFRNERTFGFLLNSNGLGGNYRYGKRIDAVRKNLYEIEFNWLKHPKEVRITPTGSNRSFIYGKVNATYTLKGALGIQKELFQKRDQGGISIRYFLNFGPSFAIQKPIYYEYYSSDYSGTYSDKFQKDPAMIPYFIGKAPFSKGFNETRIIPGIYGKYGFTFEYSRLDEVFHALELGVAFDAYINKVTIMSTPPNKLLFVLPDDQFYLTLFISYRFGKVIDTQFKQRRSKIDEVISE